MGKAKKKKKRQEPQKKKVLHVGCGMGKVHKFFQTPEWAEVRLDIDKSVRPDIVASMLDMGVVNDNEFEAIFSSHNVEHLYAHEVPVAFKEFYRVLKEGGMLLITMPDIQKVAEYIAKGRLERPLYTSPAGPISAIDILYGLRTSVAKGNTFMVHKTAFTAVTLANHLTNAGFVNLLVQRDGLNLWAKAYKNSNVDKSKDKPKIIEPDINEMMIARDNLMKEPEVWTKLNLKGN